VYQLQYQWVDALALQFSLQVMPLNFIKCGGKIQEADVCCYPVVMLFGHSTFSSPLEYSLALLPLICESSSSSDYTTQPLDCELVALASILSVDDNRNL